MRNIEGKPNCTIDAGHQCVAGQSFRLFVEIITPIGMTPTRAISFAPQMLDTI
jgi:hypothetical protein